MKCELCGSDRLDGLMYGDFLIKKGKGVHTFCLYLSSGLKQSGEENEGFLGFLPSDIEGERKRVSTIQCCYCGKMKANIGCCRARCHRNFHMICGLKFGAMNQFICTYRSFCDRHVRKVQTRPKHNDDCFICYENIYNESKGFSAVRMIRAPCCKNGWFHKSCLQKFARSAGYFFKCPLCNDCEKFKAHTALYGVFVYEKDAEWELEPNAYAELLERPRVCIAEICNNRGGRKKQTDANPFTYCITCGSVAIHRKCAPSQGGAYECNNCKKMLDTVSERFSISSQKEYSNQVGQSLQIDGGNENSDIDICGDSDDETNNIFYEASADVGKDKSACQTFNEIEDISCEYNEEFLAKSTSVPATAKHDINNDSIEIVNIDEFNDVIKDCSVILSHPKNEKITEYNKDLVDISDNQHKSENLCQREGRSKVTKERNAKSESENNVLNVSCIAQRTRRKSMAVRPLELQEQESDSNDNVIENATTSNCLQSFQYDIDDTSNYDEDIEIIEDDSTYNSYVGTQELSDINISDEYQSECNEVEYESKEKASQPELNGDKDTYVKNRNEATNPLDISCVANRTRRRSSLKLKATTMQSIPNNFPERTNKSTLSTNPQQASPSHAAYKYEEYNDGCEALVLESSSDEDSLQDNEDPSLMDYFYHLLSEVKKGPVLNTKANFIQKKVSTMNSDISCIAKRTRRCSIYTNITKNKSEEHAEMKNNRYEYLNPSSKINNMKSNTETISRSNQCGSISHADTSSSSSAADSFKSATYFGKTIQSEKQKSDIIKEFEQPAQKRKCQFDTDIPSKISTFFSDKHDNKPNINAVELSRRTNSTSQKSIDIKQTKEITNGCEEREAKATMPAVNSIQTISLIDSSSENISGNKTHTTPCINLLSPITTSSNPRRCERRRRPPRRYYDITDGRVHSKNSLGQSPTAKIANWSNLSEKEEAYIMPRYIRSNGKLKKESTNNSLLQQESPSNTFAASTNFARSYNLLLHSTNDNRHTNGSRI